VCAHQVAVADKRFDLAPVGSAIEAQADPPAPTYIRGNEESVGVRLHEGLLRARRSFAPDRHSSIAVVVVQVPGEGRVVDTEHPSGASVVLERWHTLRLLDGFGKGEADPPQSFEPSISHDLTRGAWSR
jgi:hypothetical protein